METATALAEGGRKGNCGTHWRAVRLPDIGRTTFTCDWEVHDDRSSGSHDANNGCLHDALSFVDCGRSIRTTVPSPTSGSVHTTAGARSARSTTVAIGERICSATRSRACSSTTTNSRAPSSTSANAHSSSFTRPRSNTSAAASVHDQNALDARNARTGTCDFQTVASGNNQRANVDRNAKSVAGIHTGNSSRQSSCAIFCPIIRQRCAIRQHRAKRKAERHASAAA